MSLCDFDLLQIISVAVREISEGELLQLEKARKLDITEDIYYEIIRQKFHQEYPSVFSICIIEKIFSLFSKLFNEKKLARYQSCGRKKKLIRR